MLTAELWGIFCENSGENWTSYGRSTEICSGQSLVNMDQWNIILGSVQSRHDDSGADILLWIELGSYISSCIYCWLLIVSNLW